MARYLATDTEIDDFIVLVLEAATHHGGDVSDIIRPLSDEVRKLLNLGNDTVAVYERNGQLARTCWITLSSKRYAFSYNYESKKIDLRRGSIQGPNIASFDNSTDLTTIKTVVAGL